jgi:hypothetical protein
MYFVGVCVNDSYVASSGILAGFWQKMRRVANARRVKGTAVYQLIPRGPCLSTCYSICVRQSSRGSFASLECLVRVHVCKKITQFKLF